MDFKIGDRITSGGVLGTVTEANEYEDFITARMDDDNLLLVINRKYVDRIKNSENGK